MPDCKTGRLFQDISLAHVGSRIADWMPFHMRVNASIFPLASAHLQKWEMRSFYVFPPLQEKICQHWSAFSGWVEGKALEALPWKQKGIPSTPYSWILDLAAKFPSIKLNGSSLPHWVREPRICIWARTVRGLSNPSWRVHNGHL